MQLDSNGLYDIYPLWHVPFWQTIWFYSAVIVIIALLFLVCMLFLYRKFLRRSVPLLPPWERALQALYKLQQQKYSSEEDGKLCYFKLTDIIKQYVQERFDIPMQGKSDQEALLFLENNNMPLVYEPFKEIVQGCLYIKFANQQAMQEQIQRHIALAITIVNQTKPEKKQ